MGKNKFSVKPVDALIAAILAFRTNNSSVVRFESTEQKQVDNKQLIFKYFESTPAFSDLELHELTTEAEQLKLFLEQRLTFNAITGSKTSDFLSSVVNAITKETISSRDFGIVAWAPKLYADTQQIDDVKIKLMNCGITSRYVGKISTKTTLTFTSITVKYLKEYNSFIHHGHDIDGNLIMFFNKTKIEGTTEISGRVKAHRIDERINRAQVTVLNYVKVIV